MKTNLDLVQSMNSTSYPEKGAYLTSEQNRGTSDFQRYHIETSPAPEIIPWPNPFLVKVNRLRLAKLLIQEIFNLRGDLEAITSRPCLYGTFSGPIGGFAPRPEHCVGCLRCTIQHPETVSILPNPERQTLGDSYFHFKYVNAVSQEAASGQIPVKGAGYRGKFGGRGWDSMWTDMSEIVRPTRDGIHGREFISTTVDIGIKPSYLRFDENGTPIGTIPRTLKIPLPIIFDIPPSSTASENLYGVLTEAAAQTQTLVIIPICDLDPIDSSNTNSIIPLIKPEQVDDLKTLDFNPKVIEIEDPGSLTEEALQSITSRIQSQLPECLIALRMPFPSPEKMLGYVNCGIHIFHLVADYHGCGSDGRFIIDLVRDIHRSLVEAGIREEVTLIGSGGIIAAEHVPKAIICGLDLIALDTALMVALQAHFDGEHKNRNGNSLKLPASLPQAWGVQRLKNLTAAWHNQLLEILGAMGLREVRRLRGEIGRAMFQVDLEREAFAEILGYE